jgi:hypothetical protein
MGACVESKDKDDSDIFSEIKQSNTDLVRILDEHRDQIMLGTLDSSV